MSPSSTSKPSPQAIARLLGGATKAGSRLGGAALAVIGITIVILGFTVWPLVRLLTDPPPAVAEARSEAPLLKQFSESVGKDLAQVEGRSLFAIPPKPSPRKEAARKQPTPARYGGPSVIAMVNDKVWFSDGQRLGPGESGTGDLKVLSIDAPWSARVEWEGGEFTVDFFSRSPLLHAARSGDAEHSPRNVDPPGPGAQRSEPASGTPTPPAAPEPSPAPSDPGATPPEPGSPGEPAEPAQEPANEPESARP